VDRLSNWEFHHRSGIAGLRDVAGLLCQDVSGRGVRGIGKKEADGQIRQRWHVQVDRIAYYHRLCADGPGRLSLKRYSPVGSRIDLRCGGPAGNVCAADKQRMVAIAIGDLDPDLRPTDGCVHDEAQGFIAESLETPWQETPVGLPPRSRSSVCFAD
jgi:hypothetical protein